MINRQTYEIFSQGSTTYFYSSLFFPREIKEDVFKLYSYMRTADDFCDNIPQDKKGFETFKKNTYKALKKGKSNDKIIQNIVDIHKKYDCKKEWLDAFLDAMQSDFENMKCETMEDSKKYMYGSAEVVGLYITAILSLPKRSRESAKMLGRSMQYINFLRDIKEDNKLSRQYIPQTSVNKHGLESLEETEARKKPKAFKNMMREEIKRYRKWSKQGEKGFKHIPKRMLIPIKTANDLYHWTAKQIEKDPFKIYNKKITPTKAVVGTKLISNAWSIERK